MRQWNRAVQPVKIHRAQLSSARPHGHILSPDRTKPKNLTSRSRFKISNGFWERARKDETEGKNGCFTSYNIKGNIISTSTTIQSILEAKNNRAAVASARNFHSIQITIPPKRTELETLSRYDWTDHGQDCHYDSTKDTHMKDRMEKWSAIEPVCLWKLHYHLKRAAVARALAGEDT